jgi:hypothetical protein
MMAEALADVLATGYPGIDEATEDVEPLVALVRNTPLSIEGAILVTHADDGRVAVRQTCDNRGRKGLRWGGGSRSWTSDLLSAPGVRVGARATVVRSVCARPARFGDPERHSQSTPRKLIDRRL